MSLFFLFEVFVDPMTVEKLEGTVKSRKSNSGWRDQSMVEAINPS